MKIRNSVTIRYENPKFSSVGPFSKRVEGSTKFWQEAELLLIFSIDVAPKRNKKLIEIDVKFYDKNNFKFQQFDFFCQNGYFDCEKH